jgi:hypothetical protein
VYVDSNRTTRLLWVSEKISLVTRRRTLLGALATTGIAALAGCSTSQNDGSEPNANTSSADNSDPSAGDETSETTGEGGDEATEGQSSSAAAAVETYYTAAANGNLERAAGQLAPTQYEGGESQTVEEMATVLRERGLSSEGVDVTLGEFRKLSLSEFREFTFQLDGETREFTDDEFDQIVPNASAFGGDDERVSLVQHTGGFLPKLWVPYQPLEAPSDGWGEVIVEVGKFDGEPYLIGDFRTFTEIKVVDD